MIKLAISGARGKMGKRIIALAQEDNNIEIVSILEYDGHPEIGEVICDGVNLSSNEADIKNCDVLIEFSSPSATVSHLDVAAKLGKKVIVGTTGLSKDDTTKIIQASKKTAIVFSPNMSVGVNILFDLLKRVMNKISNGYNIDITEAHHVHKKDAPSGTAKELARIIEDSGKKVSNIESIREDEIVGDHKIVLSSDVDTLTLTHSAKTRDIFAGGALVAAKWIVNKENGLYGMDNVLELDK